MLELPHDGRRAVDGRDGRAVDRAGDRVDVEALTVAEQRVLELLPTHLPQGMIASELHVSRNTVKTHTASIYRKLGVTSRADAVDVARSVGLLA